MKNLDIKAQSGYALATSLLLLVVMAGLGISMFGNVTLQEKMSDNLSVKNRSMLVADSALQSSFTFEALNSHIRVGGEKTVEELASDFSDTVVGTEINMTGKVSICYLGYIQAAGNSMNNSQSNGGQYAGNVNHIFVAAAYAEEIATNSITTVEQGGYIEGQKPVEDFTTCDAYAAGFDVGKDLTENIVTGAES